MTTRGMMWAVCAALLPVAIAAVWERGTGALLQIILAVIGCAAWEAGCLALRKKSIHALADGSAVVAGVIIGLCLPPLAPWFVALAAAGFAMALAKHCYGGLGGNPFNPAMAGYALAFVSFPADFDGWNASYNAWEAIFYGASADAVSTPTPLSAARLGIDVAPPSLLFAASCVLGGIPLLLLRVADWRLVAGFIVGALVFCDGDWSHFLTGGLMLAAFFVITDPVTAAVTARGKLLYGFAGGAFVVLLRRYGAHADAIAFAILACNMLAPLADKIVSWRR